MVSSARAIVIGTGAGGLATAAHLARDGFEVLALEKSPHFGGALAPLQRDGFHFDPGLQSVGECRPGQSTHTFFDELDLDADALFVELEPTGFEVLRFPDFEVPLCAGTERMRRQLEERFPDEREGITRFFRLLGRIRALRTMNESWQQTGPDFDAISETLRRLGLLPWMRSPATNLLDWVTDDRRLQAVLASAAARWGMPPSRTSALHLLRVFAHFVDGAFYPRGGTGQLRDALVDAARRHGATFRANTRVSDVVVEDERAVGVYTELDERIDADVVVANVDPTVLYDKLLAPADVPRKLRSKLRLTQPSPAPFQLLLGLARPPGDFGIGAFDVSDFPSFDIDATYAPLFNGQFGDVHPLFVSSSSAKSRSTRMAPEGHSTLQVSTFAPYELFADRWGDAGPDKYSYREFRQIMADELLVELEARLPGLADDVVFSEVITPLSHARWNNAAEGAAFGPAQSPTRTLMFRFGTKTPVANLFLAGSGALGVGLAEALRSGRVAAKMAARRLTTRRPPPPPKTPPPPSSFPEA